MQKRPGRKHGDVGVVGDVGDVGENLGVVGYVRKISELSERLSEKSSEKISGRCWRKYWRRQIHYRKLLDYFLHHFVFIYSPMIFNRLNDNFVTRSLPHGCL